jgi:cell division protein FtsL
VEKALLIALLVVVLAQTVAVFYATSTQRKQLYDMKVEMTELRIQIRAEFLRIQDVLDKDEDKKKQGKADDALPPQVPVRS